MEMRTIVLTSRYWKLALLGFIAYHYSLDVAMGFTATLLLLVGISYAIKSAGKASARS